MYNDSNKNQEGELSEHSPKTAHENLTISHLFSDLQLQEQSSSDTTTKAVDLNPEIPLDYSDDDEKSDPFPFKNSDQSLMSPISLRFRKSQSPNSQPEKDSQLSTSTIAACATARVRLAPIALYRAIFTIRRMYASELRNVNATVPFALGKSYNEWKRTTQRYFNRRCVPERLAATLLARIDRLYENYFVEHSQNLVN
ncbi:hypothetical protein ACOME3_005147 [Neoechinorhynchus agilis]